MNKKFHFLLGLSCLGLAIGVIAGAVGAHILEAQISSRSLVIFNKAVLYQIIHCLGIFGLCLYGLIKESKFILFIGYAFLIGIFLFSGSLYFYVLSNDSFWVHITPVGGMTWIVSWFSLSVFFIIKTFKK